MLRLSMDLIPLPPNKGQPSDWYLQLFRYKVLFLANLKSQFLVLFVKKYNRTKQPFSYVMKIRNVYEKFGRKDNFEFADFRYVLNGV